MVYFQKVKITSLYLNADAGFDSDKFRLICVQEGIICNIDENKCNSNKHRDILIDYELYSLQYGIERTNAWMDSFRAILNRFDLTISSWTGWNYISFMIIAIKNSNKIS